jgi:two-component system, chemotaxis family, protein-glutamate methylesterase/glutaminase
MMKLEPGPSCHSTSLNSRKIDAIVIGASAGAVEALSKLLPGFRADYPVPIIIVVHVPSNSENSLCKLMAPICSIQLREAEDKENLCPGNVYFAPPDYHVLIESDHRISLSSEKEVLFSRPSIDVLFESAADVFGHRLLGIILTGANHDGANGLWAIAQAGGVVIVQNPAYAYASAMPESALARCPLAFVLDLDEISDLLSRMTPTGIIDI